MHRTGNNNSGKNETSTQDENIDDANGYCNPVTAIRKVKKEKNEKSSNINNLCKSNDDCKNEKDAQQSQRPTQNEKRTSPLVARGEKNKIIDDKDDDDNENDVDGKNSNPLAALAPMETCKKQKRIRALSPPALSAGVRIGGILEPPQSHYANYYYQQEQHHPPRQAQHDQYHHHQATAAYYHHYQMMMQYYHHSPPHGYNNNYPPLPSHYHYGHPPQPFVTNYPHQSATSQQNVPKSPQQPREQPTQIPTSNFAKKRREINKKSNSSSGSDDACNLTTSTQPVIRANQQQIMPVASSQKRRYSKPATKMKNNESDDASSHRLTYPGREGKPKSRQQVFDEVWRDVSQYHYGFKRGYKKSISELKRQKDMNKRSDIGLCHLMCLAGYKHQQEQQQNQIRQNKSDNDDDDDDDEQQQQFVLENNDQLLNDVMMLLTSIKENLLKRTKIPRFKNELLKKKDSMGNDTVKLEEDVDGNNTGNSNEEDTEEDGPLFKSGKTISV